MSKQLSIEESDKWPYCTISKIKGTFCDKNNKIVNFFATGTLIAPGIVLTFAHNVYNLEFQAEAYNLELYPASNENSFCVFSKVKKFRYPEEYKNCNPQVQDQYKHDYGVLYLEKIFEDYYGFLGMKNYDQIQEKLDLSLYGYSHYEEGKKMRGMAGEVKFEDSFIRYSTIDTLPGQSGSPLFRKENEEYFIARIHIASFQDYSQAIKLNAEKL